MGRNHKRWRDRRRNKKEHEENKNQNKKKNKNDDRSSSPPRRRRPENANLRRDNDGFQDNFVSDTIRKGNLKMELYYALQGIHDYRWTKDGGESSSSSSFSLVACANDDEKNAERLRWRDSMGKILPSSFRFARHVPDAIKERMHEELQELVRHTANRVDKSNSGDDDGRKEEREGEPAKGEEEEQQQHSQAKKQNDDDDGKNDTKGDPPADDNNTADKEIKDGPSPSSTNSSNSIALGRLSFCPYGYQLAYDRSSIRKRVEMERLHDWLKRHTDDGSVSRQESVSMIPPVVLDPAAGDRVLDMCAAPGSKTAQLLEALDYNAGGCLIANDANSQRAYLLVHQLRRILHHTPVCLITACEAQFFPTMFTTTNSTTTAATAKHDNNKNNENDDAKDNNHRSCSVLQFDSILADVPCTGDGTSRKNIHVWSKWTPQSALGLHNLQLNIAWKGVSELLQVGGTMCYSTCSMNPVENEAVVAELLRRAPAGSLELVPNVARDRLRGFKTRPGMSSWKVFCDADTKTNRQRKNAAKKQNAKMQARRKAWQEKEQEQEQKIQRREEEKAAPADADEERRRDDKEPNDGKKKVEDAEEVKDSAAGAAAAPAPAAAAPAAAKGEEERQLQDSATTMAPAVRGADPKQEDRNRQHPREENGHHNEAAAAPVLAAAPSSEGEEGKDAATATENNDDDDDDDTKPLFDPESMDERYLMEMAEKDAGMRYFETFDDVPQDFRSRVRKTVFSPQAPEERERFHLERCIRCLPHDEDTGGFFVALLRKTGPISKMDQRAADAAVETIASTVATSENIKEESNDVIDASEQQEQKGKEEDKGEPRISGLAAKEADMEEAGDELVATSSPVAKRQKVDEDVEEMVKVEEAKAGTNGNEEVVVDADDAMDIAATNDDDDDGNGALPGDKKGASSRSPSSCSRPQQQRGGGGNERCRKGHFLRDEQGNIHQGGLGKDDFVPVPDDIMDQLCEFYGLSAAATGFRRDLYMTRACGAAKVIYFLGRPVKDNFISAGLQRRVTIVNSGLKGFVRNNRESKRNNKSNCSDKGNDDGDAVETHSYRVAQEGVHFLAPHMTKRKYVVSHEDFAKCLELAGTSSTVSLDGSCFSEAFKSRMLAECSVGSFVVVLEGFQDRPEEKMFLTMWRNRSRSVNGLVAKMEIHAIRNKLQALGGTTTTTSTTTIAAAATEAGQHNERHNEKIKQEE